MERVHKCHKWADCANTRNSYLCECLPGNRLLGARINFTSRTKLCFFWASSNGTLFLCWSLGLWSVWALLLVTWACKLNSKISERLIEWQYRLQIFDFFINHNYILFNSNRYWLGFINISKFSEYCCKYKARPDHWPSLLLVEALHSWHSSDQVSLNDLMFSSHDTTL